MLDYEPKIMQWFQRYGYQITKISEDKDETPDFLISDSSSIYLPAARLDGSRAGRRACVPARGDAGKEYLGADGG